VSSWTTDQIRELIESVNVERDRRYDQRFDYIEQKIDNGFATAKEAVASALTAAKEAVAAEAKSAKEAITKQEIATEKRFESVNEFRSQLKDQQVTLLPRAEADGRFSQLRDLVDKQDSRIGILERSESRGAGSESAAQLARQNAARITALMVTIALSVLGLTVGLIYFLAGKH